MANAILIVDTDRSALALMAHSASAAGYVVTPADSFEDATALLRGHGFTAVVTAHYLDVHNGLHLVLRARAEHASVVTVVTTPAPDPVLEEEAALFGAVTVVAPWSDPAVLLAALGRARSIQPA